MVIEAGTTKSKLSTSGEFDILDSFLDHKSGGSFGGALGWRSITESNMLFGLEGSFASNGGEVDVADGEVVIEGKSSYGIYFTGGGAFGADQQAKIYALVGVGGAKYSLDNVSETGEGFSFGGAFEYSFTDNFGLRVKALHTSYKSDLDGAKLKDTSLMGGLVISF